MRHHRKGRKFGMVAGKRRSLLRGLAASLILRGKIMTTEAKAKELRSFVEPLITKARRGDLARRRTIIQALPKSAAMKAADEIGPKFREQAGGYTRIIKLGRRKSDGAEMALIELVK